MGIIKAILSKPSPRTMLEASMAGLVTLMIISLGSAIYTIFFTDISIFLKIMSGVGAIAIEVLLFGNLVTVYQQYTSLKNVLELSKLWNPPPSPSDKEETNENVESI